MNVDVRMRYLVETAKTFTFSNVFFSKHVSYLFPLEDGELGNNSPQFNRIFPLQAT